MSHDRGCPCGKEPYEYDDCKDPSCSKRERSVADASLKPGWLRENIKNAATTRSLDMKFLILRGMYVNRPHVQRMIDALMANEAKADARQEAARLRAEADRIEKEAGVM